jgi:peptidase M28-like protein
LEESVKRRRHVVGSLVVVAALAFLPVGALGGPASIKVDDLREWLSFIASDDTQGRALFSAGLGLAAGYISDHLRVWGVRPGGDHSSYLQTVRVLGVKSTSHSTITVQVGSESRTFADNDALVFPRNAGAKQRLTIDRVEFAGYGLDLPAAHHADFANKDMTGAAVIWLGTDGPKEVDAQKYRLLLQQRGRSAVEQAHAAASVGPDTPSAGRRGGAGAPPAAGQGTNAGGRGAAAADFTTVERLDKRVPPAIGAKDAFFEFLFSRAPVKYDELRRKAQARDSLPTFRLDAVKLTFNVDVDYEIVRTQLTHNVVAIVEGSDPLLKNTYVAFGAHYDHVGYADAEIATGDNPRRTRAPGRVTPGALDDRIWNGADDDGSGTVGLMALARAFAEGPRPKRSLLFVWHTGEEVGRYGSLYFADYPTVPLDGIVAQLNIDMIGRNRDNNPDEANTLYLVGSDRISSELHAISRAANAALPRPMTLDYEFNDPSDTESLYTRSDHYSYASKGIPVIFFTTGLHPDYHANTDEVSRIEFDKMTRVLGYVYETASRLANLDHVPLRDNKGARAGKSPITP